MPGQLVWVEDGESRQATIVRRGRNATSTMSRSYKVFGTADDVELHADINAKISSGGYGWQYPGVSDAKLWVESYSVSFLGDNAWQVTINYEKKGAEPSEQTPLKRARSFDTTGATQHYTNAIDDPSMPFGERHYPSTPSRPMFGAINVDSNGVNGVDVIVPQLQWTEQYDVPSAYVTSSYIKGVAEITGTTNKNAFRSFAPGEVLFAGCSGSQEWDQQKGNGPWSLSYKFIASPNAGNGDTVPAIKIGDISGIHKKGHEYIWVSYEETEQSNVLTKKPRDVYVNKVYRDGDFSTLGIGVT